MQVFQYVAGAASILSLIIALVTLGKVIRIGDVVVDNSKKSSRQSFRARDVNESSVNQTGGDSHGGTGS